jgi:iron-sulfur cluster repair protein YtfE (RIC family)
VKITDRFVGDHKTFRKIMNDIELIPTSMDEAHRRKLIRSLELFVDHLLLHAWGEETFFYPEVAKAAVLSEPVADAAYMKLLDDEHHHIDTTLRDVEAMVKAASAPAQWRPKYEVFKQHLVAHMTKEEQEFFPLSERLLGKEGLEKISQTLEQNRNRAPAVRIHQKI